MKKTLLGIIVSLGAAVVSCDRGSGLSGLNNEALQLGKKFYEERLFLHCGDSWFRETFALGRRWGFFQFKNLDYDLEEFPITAADKANGLEWKGRLFTKATIFREYASLGGWSQWRDWAPPQFAPYSSVDIYRKNGQWQVAPETNYKYKYSCSDIPPG